MSRLEVYLNRSKPPTGEMVVIAPVQGDEVIRLRWPRVICVQTGM